MSNFKNHLMQEQILKERHEQHRTKRVLKEKYEAALEGLLYAEALTNPKVRLYLNKTFDRLHKYMEEGILNDTKAIDYLVKHNLRDAAKAYCKRTGTEQKWWRVFPKRVRQQAALWLLEHCKEQFDARQKA